MYLQILDSVTITHGAASACVVETFHIQRYNYLITTVPTAEILHGWWYSYLPTNVVLLPLLKTCHRWCYYLSPVLPLLGALKYSTSVIYTQRNNCCHS